MAMRLMLVLVALGAVSACAEAVHGPRLVTYTPDRFYIRYLPLRDSPSSIDAMADARCRESGKQAVLESAQQDVVLDLRYATFRCVSGAAVDEAL